MRALLRDDLMALMRIPGLAGHEERVRAAIRARLAASGITARSDVPGNLVASFPGDAGAPRVMVFAHMDQPGFVVRRIGEDGLLRLARLGGVPERALAAQEVLVQLGEGRDLPGVIANKAHHATAPDERLRVVPAAEVFVDTGLASRAAVEAAGVRIGTPVVWAPRAVELGSGRVMGTAVDDRAGCAVLLALARILQGRRSGPTVHLVFSVQEEFNLRGAQVAAQALAPDIAFQIDIMLATDTPDMAGLGEMRLGGGPGMSLYSFHGRGTLNGVLPHPALVALLEETAAVLGIPLQRSAQVGVLTDLSYVQLVGRGVAALDVGFPMRYAHSAREMCDIADLEALTGLLAAALERIGAGFDLVRE
jgi:putative aminopeptidase FrvX